MAVVMVGRVYTRVEFLGMLAAAGGAAWMTGCENSSEDGGSGERVYLTFDDGPGPDTPEILDALQGARATFFMLGRHVDRYPDLARKVKADGHVVGSHSYSHIDFDRATLDQITHEIDAAGAAIEAALGRKPTLFRPPYLSGNAAADQVAIDRGYRVVRGTNTHDYDSDDSSQVAGRVLRNLNPGQVLMFHDSDPSGTASRRVTVGAIRLLVPELRARGYSLARLS